MIESGTNIPKQTNSLSATKTGVSENYSSTGIDVH